VKCRSLEAGRAADNESAMLVPPETACRANNDGSIPTNARDAWGVAFKIIWRSVSGLLMGWSASSHPQERDYKRDTEEASYGTAHNRR